MFKFQRNGRVVEGVRKEGLITAFVRENCDKIVSRSEVAKKLGVSAETVSNHIRTETGMKFQDFLQEIRIAKATTLLESTNLNVSQIAYQVGFASPEHFSRVFRNATGESPSQYRLARRIEKASAG